MTQLVFVYGTLRQGECNHHLLENSDFLGHYQSQKDYHLFDVGPYPALIDGKQSVYGEVYRIDEATLAQLDILEDVPIEYRREQINTPYGQAWIYLYQDEDALDNPIQSGDWCQRV
ncbi:MULTISPECIES: gamma-glutamylcyclotransferase [unclassified Vibrio]|uniref:Gamma-glutamylcyclotransferase family protein n=1 Tax=Vibrio sp. HB236076 TaxID=3232307 RepID=A0AB39HF98_9VIBR|nr:gamma-glutamylcyclotransferase [Vibrio sp. HB161653]MDP5255589.1 gamma-glutamylcyclotransferase [Vibrio sp. HB161653]